MVVTQLGARMHYAVPRILQRANLLERFYTDICARKGWHGALRLWPRNLRPAKLQRLLSRDPEGIPASRIVAFTGMGFEYARRLARARSVDERTEAYLWSGREFCRRVVENGFGSANAVYTFNSAGLEILQAARERGLKCVMEQTIAPSSFEQEILRKEAEAFPGWERPVTHGAVMDEYAQREKDEWALADLIVCGSDFVREGIAACGGPVDKCVVVPYGIESEVAPPLPAGRVPGPLRVFVAGAVGLRKGAPHVLAAGEKMAGRAEFRWAGSISVLPEAEQRMRRFVQLAGIIPRPEMQAQYEWADVFLLPSLCEGSATVTYEALFRGRPVICTPQTGSTIRDGVDGFIVPARDPDAIVNKLELLASKTGLLATMSENARQASQENTLAKYGERLLRCFREHGVIS